MIVVFGSWRGIGATTTALLSASCLAAAEGGAWLIEADPAGGVLAGRMQLPSRTVGGLERVAFPTDRHEPVEAFEAVAHRVGPLRVVTAPADPFRGFSCHRPRVPWVPALRDLPGSVVVDIGRVRAGAPTWALMELADLVVMVATPEVATAVASVEWLHAAGRVSPSEPGLLDRSARLVVVDAPGGVAFPRATLMGELGGDCAGWLPWDPTTVDLFHRGAAADDRRLRRSPLVAAVNQMVLALTLASGAVR